MISLISQLFPNSSVERRIKNGTNYKEKEDCVQSGPLNMLNCEHITGHMWKIQFPIINKLNSVLKKQDTSTSNTLYLSGSWGKNKNKRFYMQNKNF